MNDTLVTWYNNVLKVLGCLTLFMTANLLKVGFAKMVASKFNQQAHYQKMHDALKRVGPGGGAWRHLRPGSVAWL